MMGCIMKNEYISIKRDGLTLRGKIMRSDTEKCPMAIMFHGFTGDIDERPESMFETISRGLLEKGVSTIRFDFNGHGKSDGDFSNMNLFNEMLDAIAEIEYVRSLDYVTDIYVMGHSQGGVIAGMLAGYYCDVVKKLVLLEPAATLKDDSLKGQCMAAKYDPQNIPLLVDAFGNGSKMVGGHFFRIAQLMPIYEVTAKYKNPMLVVHSENDEVVDMIAAKRYKDAMDNCRLAVYEKMNHNMEGEEFEPAMQHVVDFIFEI